MHSCEHSMLQQTTKINYFFDLLKQENKTMKCVQMSNGGPK